MDKIKKGDVVGRISHGMDILFRVKKIISLKNGKKLVILKGISERIEADCYIEDLYLITKNKVKEELEKIDKKINKRILKNTNEGNNRSQKIQTGKILHLDGDRKYSEKSIIYYKKMGLDAIVKNIPENRQPKLVYNLLMYYNPDILVITGHDGMIRTETGYYDIYNYRNSRHFIQTVKEARRYEKENNKNLVIFAGACQSYFEGIISAGANFASSPARILIDILDPLIVAEKIATTDMLKYVTIRDIENDLRDGSRGVGGIGANREEKSTTVNIL